MGEARYTSGTLPTRYTYTGQYSYASDFGLVFYGSRFYDPLLSRWTSPDSIIPQGQGTQAWDRYAYVNNSPLNYTDPTGHMYDDGCNTTGCDSGSGNNNGLSQITPTQSTPRQSIPHQSTPQPTLPPRGFIPPNNNFPTPEDQNGLSDPDLKAWFFFWDNVALPFFDSVEAYDVYRFTSKGGYRAFRYALPTRYLEAGIAGFQQGYVDRNNSSLSTTDKGIRILTVSAETLLIDLAADAVGTVGAALGAELGPPGAFAGYFSGTILGTAAGDLFFSSINQELNLFGVSR